MSVLESQAILPDFVKVRWFEPYVSAGINQKMFRTVPRGIYSGFVVKPGPGAYEVTVHSDHVSGWGETNGFSKGDFDSASGWSIAVHESLSGYAETILFSMNVSGASGFDGNFTFDLSTYAGQDVYIAVESFYRPGFQSTANVRAVEASDLDANPALINLAKVEVPLSAPILDSHIIVDDPTYPRVEPFATRNKFGYLSKFQFRTLTRLKDIVASELTSTGKLRWEVLGSGLVDWLADLKVRIFSRGLTYTVSAGSVALSDGDIAFVKVHDLVGGTLTVDVAPIGSYKFDEENYMHFPLFYREGTKIHVPYGDLSLDSGESDTIGEDLPASQRDRLGITSETGFEAYTSVLKIALADTHPAAISKLDLAFHTATGHDHDGTDSKKVLGTNLDSTGEIVGKVPTSNGSGGTTWSVPIPVGTILSWQGGYYTGAANAGFTDVLGNTVAAANAYVGPNYKVCDGASYSDADSPIYSGAGKFLPDLTDDRFLMGSTSAGSIGGTNSGDHTHTLTISSDSHGHSISIPNHASHDHTIGNQTIPISDGDLWARIDPESDIDLVFPNPDGDGWFYDQDTSVTTWTADGAWVNPGDEGGSGLEAGYWSNSDITTSSSRPGGIVVDGTVPAHNHGGDTGDEVLTHSNGSTTANYVHSHAGSTAATTVLDNRPKYLSMFFIQRVK